MRLRLNCDWIRSPCSTLGKYTVAALLTSVGSMNSNSKKAVVTVFDRNNAQ